MLVYRTLPFLPAAEAGEPGHPMYVHRPQGRGRLDNPDQYDAWYFGVTPETAVAETFADLAVWRSSMFTYPALPGSQRVLGVFEIPDDARILDLDDANALRDRALRPTQVVARNRTVTQAWALRFFNETDGAGERTWDGVRWWSYHRPQWTVIALLTPRDEAALHTCLRTEPLTLTHPAVVDAARSLGRRPIP